MQKVAEQLTTIRDMVRWGVSRFNQAELAFAHGMPGALDEAVYLCLSALNLPPDFSAEYFDCALTTEEKKAVLAVYQQRIETRKPAAYITHEAWFAGLSFYVDERVLVPRSPIAELIGNRFMPWIEPDSVQHILDLCTGSGCIAIACAHAFPDAEVVASDISDDALTVAEINRRRYSLQNRLQLVQSDLYADVPPQPYDIIVCNPPYVSSEEMQTLAREFSFEPSMGLEAGDLGLDFIVPVLQGAREFLSDDGILVAEVGYTWPVLEQCFPKVPFLWPEFEHGGEGVFILSADELEQYESVFAGVASRRYSL